MQNNLATVYQFTGSEKDFEAHVEDNITHISNMLEWGNIVRIERQFVLPFGTRRVIVDMMLWHADGSGTVLECKTGRTNRNDLIGGIGQLMFYGHKIKQLLGSLPRMVLAAPQIEPMLLDVVQEFNVPISLLVIDGDRCAYLS